MPNVVIVNAETGEEITRPLTADESTVRATEAAEAQARIQVEGAAQEEMTQATTVLMEMRAKAVSVADSNGAFTDAEMQKIVAALAIRSIR